MAYQRNNNLPISDAPAPQQDICRASNEWCTVAYNLFRFPDQEYYEALETVVWTYNTAGTNETCGFKSGNETDLYDSHCGMGIFSYTY